MPVSALCIEIAYYRHFCLIVLRGELDALERHNQIVVDAAELAFCDCAGIALLAAAHQRAAAGGGGLSLAFAYGLLLRLLEVDRRVGQGPGSELVTTLGW
ncbi:STAS domain-containing protein [Streptosporangium sp. NPDC087985]|uniref:STAS domain-containing protein n=1 Tax=Streptosporangium sp. NPDC087985 TaxID=3366196 RepID=UPI00380D14DD